MDEDRPRDFVECDLELVGEDVIEDAEDDDEEGDVLRGANVPLEFEAAEMAKLRRDPNQDGTNPGVTPPPFPLFDDL
jgi:hypothetical protein